MATNEEIYGIMYSVEQGKASRLAKGLPIVAIATTSGTGLNGFGVISNLETKEVGSATWGLPQYWRLLIRDS